MLGGFGLSCHHVAKTNCMTLVLFIQLTFRCRRKTQRSLFIFFTFHRSKSKPMDIHKKSFWLVAFKQIVSINNVLLRNYFTVFNVSQRGEPQTHSWGVQQWMRHLNLSYPNVFHFRHISDTNKSDKNKKPSINGVLFSLK